MITVISTVWSQPRSPQTSTQILENIVSTLKMVVLVLVSVGMVLPTATDAFNCCFRPPNISALGPPPRPPGINFDLRCNGSGGVEKFPSQPNPTVSTRIEAKSTQWPPSSLTKGPMVSPTTVSRQGSPMAAASTASSTTSLSLSTTEGQSLPRNTHTDSHTRTVPHLTSVLSPHHLPASSPPVLPSHHTLGPGGSSLKPTHDAATDKIVKSHMSTSTVVIETVKGSRSQSAGGEQSKMADSTLAPSTSEDSTSSMQISLSSVMTSPLVSTSSTNALSVLTKRSESEIDLPLQVTSSIMPAAAASTNVWGISTGKTSISKMTSTASPLVSSAVTYMGAMTTVSPSPSNWSSGGDTSKLGVPMATNDTGTGNVTSTPTDGEVPPDVNKSQGQGGLGGGELAALGLGLLVIIAILCVLALYWKKRYKPNADDSPRARVKPTPVKEETNYLYNYRMRGWNWRPGNGTRHAHLDDIERPEDKKALITSPVTSHMSLSSGSMDAGYGGDQPGGGGDDGELVLLRSAMRTENSMSSGIGLSQCDLHDYYGRDEFTTGSGAGTVQLMNGDSGVNHRNSREMKARYVHRSTSNPGMTQRANHSGPRMAKSLSSHNRLDKSLPAEKLLPNSHHLQLQNGQTRVAKSGTLPILEPIRTLQGPEICASLIRPRPDFDPSSLPSGKPRPQSEPEPVGERPSRLQPLQNCHSPDSARSKKKKKKRKASPGNSSPHAYQGDTVAMDTISPTSLSRLAPISGNSPRLKEPPKNGESKA